MLKSRKLVMLMLPVMVAFLFQATQYARAPVAYGYYIVYARNADIALREGTDLAPNGQTLLQNSTTQEGLYNLTLGKWGPGYSVNYSDAFHIINREAFNITLIAANFSGDSTGLSYIKIYIYNDTDYDGTGDTEVCVWDGTQTLLNSTNFIWFRKTDTYGTDGGDSGAKIEILIPESGIGLSGGTPELIYHGKMLLWFTSESF